MAGMKRFVTYIYVYENKEKGNNIGFAKIEIRGEECRLEIHLRGVYTRLAICKVYLFRESEGEMEGVYIGEMKILNGNGNFATIVRASHVGESVFGINNMEGLLLLGEDDSIFMSRWKEGRPLAVCREKFHIWRPEPEMEIPKKEIHVSDAVMREQPKKSNVNMEQETAKTAEIEKEKAQTEKEEAQTEKRETQTEKEVAENELPRDIMIAQQEMEEGETQGVHTAEIPMRNIFPTYNWKNVWETLKENHKLYRPFVDKEAECIQIELKDLRELPKRYWYLGNNSFLLHGFFNCQYLVVGKTGQERWFIGVPGVYQRQERVMAAIFGFPEFIAMQQDGAGEEKEPVNHFGCWYRFIEE